MGVVDVARTIRGACRGQFCCVTAAEESIDVKELRGLSEQALCSATFEGNGMNEVSFGSVQAPR